MAIIDVSADGARVRVELIQTTAKKRGFPHYLYSMDNGCWKLLEAAEDYRRLLEAAGDYWRLLEAAECYWRLLETTGGCWRLLEAAGGY